MYKISVIIPTYKPEEEFKFCLESLEHQTMPKTDYEVVIILNGEKEPYEQFIMKTIENLSFYARFFYLSEKGVSNARNFGINKALGEYITFLDADDWLSENYLDSLYETTKAKNKLVVSNVLCYNPEDNTYSIDFLGRLFSKLKKDKVYSHVKVRSYFSVPWAKLLPAKVCKENKFDNRFNYGEDALFMFTIEPFLHKTIKSEENVIYYRRYSPVSLSNQKRSKKEIRIIHFRLLKEYWKIYIHNLLKYNPCFFINRNLAIIKHIIKVY